jgi:TRAP-type mannitol/chloroaromatic compound transport system permease large subunit
MTDPQIAVLMLGIFILLILLGFPIAFTLIAMGVGFGYYAYYDPVRMDTIFDNRIFDLLVNQTYSVMANDVLTAVPLFLFMGYIVERANIVDRLFYTLNISARAIPGSMAIAAIITCALFATATGIIGAVVTLMGLLALPAMLRARYDTSFASGVICAGGCLGIMIPPSIMLIVYSATSNVSVVKLYAGALLPGFMLAGLYLLYVVGRVLFNPKLAPKPSPEDVPDVSRAKMFLMLATSFFPLFFLILAVLGAILFGLTTPSEAAAIGALGGMVLAVAYRAAAINDGTQTAPWAGQRWSGLDTLFYVMGYGGAVTLLLTFVYVAVRAALISYAGIAMPDEPGFLIRAGSMLVLALIIGLLSRTALLGSLQPRRPEIARMFVYGGQGAALGLAGAAGYMIVFEVFQLGEMFAGHETNFRAFDIGFFAGLAGMMMWRIVDQDKLRESIYLTVRTSAMVCWLFVGSWTFASVFSYLGGEELISEFVLGLDLEPWMFLLLAQVIIFLLGWPLEWSEIIIIFVPIFLPLLPAFGVDPLFFGILIALNLQTSFLTPPMAMSAYYLKGVAPPHVKLTQIFAGVMPFLAMIFLSMFLLYQFPGIALWLPEVLYGN